MTNELDKYRKFERIFAVVAFAAIIAAWLIGAVRQDADLEPFLKKAVPGTTELESIDNGIFAGKKQGSTTGFVAVGESGGYGGPIHVAVGLDNSGNILGISIIDHKETEPFFQKLLAKDYPNILVGKNYNDQFSPAKDVDGVSGATVSLNALLYSVRQAARHVAENALKLPVEPEKTKPFKFGLPEIILLLLFAAGLAGYSKHLRQKPKPQKTIRWVSRITGLLILGFVYTIPLSIININSLLMGYWPDWHTHLYWYLMMVGVLLPLVLIQKSPYCDSICPFGAAQEVLKSIGGAKRRLPDKLHLGLRWVQRLLAVAVIVAALLFRNPGQYNYEVFGTFFNLTGNYIQYGLLAVVLIASLFITRPWCNYLCPLRTVSDLARSINQWVKRKK